MNRYCVHVLVVAVLLALPSALETESSRTVRAR